MGDALKSTIADFGSVGTQSVEILDVKQMGSDSVEVNFTVTCMNSNFAAFTTNQPDGTFILSLTNNLYNCAGLQVSITLITTLTAEVRACTLASPQGCHGDNTERCVSADSQLQEICR